MYFSIKATSPIRPPLTSCGHATHQLTWAYRYIDPYITIQANVIHTIARRMDDESKNPNVST